MGASVSKDVNHLRLLGANGYEDIDVYTLHVSCKSDRFQQNKNYIGMVLYQYMGNNEWTLNGVRCKSGYIFLADSESLNQDTSLKGDMTMHEKAYYRLFREKIPEEGKLVAWGFGFQNREWKENSTTFNNKQTPYTDEKRRDGVTEFNIVLKAILSWAEGNGQNYSTVGWKLEGHNGAGASGGCF